MYFFFSFRNNFRIINASQRDSTQIYSYLEKVLPYSKQQLEKEVNDIAIKKIQSEVRVLEREVQMEINNLMPGAISNYEIDLKRVEEQRALHKGSDKPEQFRNSRRKFPWNSKLRYSKYNFHFLPLYRLESINISAFVVNFPFQIGCA